MLSPPSKVVKIGEFKEFILTLIADLFDITKGLELFYQYRSSRFLYLIKE